MGEDTISFVISLKGGTESAAQIAKVKTAVNEAGGSLKQFGGTTSAVGRSAGRFTSGLKGMLVQLGLVGLAYKSYSSAKNAILFTKNLAESTSKLTTSTGLSVEKASAYLNIAEALGVPQASLTTSFTKLSKQAVKQSEATGKTITAFDKLGISTKFVREHAHDFNGILDKTLERLKGMPAGIQKTALESEIFGKGWAALNPLLGEGAEHLRHLLDVAKKYGAVLSGGTTKELAQLREAQVESTLATDGLRISFTKLAGPSLIAALKGFARLKNDLRTNNMKGFNAEVGKLATVFEKVIEVFEENAIEGFGQTGPRMAKALWHGFQGASLGNELLIAGALATKLGLTGTIFKALGKLLGKQVAVGAAAEIGSAAAGASVAGTFATVFVAALPAALAAAGIVGVFKAFMSPPEKEVPYKPLHKALQKSIATGKPIPHAFGGEKETTVYGPGRSKVLEQERLRRLHGEGMPVNRGKPEWHRHEEAAPAHGAFGARTVAAGLVEVGERGPELLNLPPAATVEPLTHGAVEPGGDIVLKVDGRELARVNRRQALQSQASGA